MKIVEKDFFIKILCYKINEFVRLQEIKYIKNC